MRGIPPLIVRHGGGDQAIIALVHGVDYSANILVVQLQMQHIAFQKCSVVGNTARNNTLVAVPFDGPVIWIGPLVCHDYTLKAILPPGSDN